MFEFYFFKESFGDVDLWNDGGVDKKLELSLFSLFSLLSLFSLFILLGLLSLLDLFYEKVEVYEKNIDEKGMYEVMKICE